MLSSAVNTDVKLTPMLKTVTIENFRGFQSFELQNLGRLNLLVGKNNSGKTSILEGIRLLCSSDDLEPLRETMTSRGEYLWGDSERCPELDVRHLFHNHEIEVGSQFSILGVDENRQETLRASIGIYRENRKSHSNFDTGQEHSVDTEIDDFQLLDFTLKWISGNEDRKWTRPLSSNGGLSDNYFRRKVMSTFKDERRVTGTFRNSGTTTQFITSSALSSTEMIDLFDEVVLTPEEDLVVEALQTIDPRIIRIASVSSEKYRYPEARGGFVVRFSDSNQRIPIGSMGDGMWGILGLALATVGASNGVLLVDEIDTGLHFTAMSDMWKLVWETAKRLNVQVFATTHSSDCWMSLADIASREDTAEDGITIQRIEKGKNVGVAFSREQILAAAKWDIEVR